jgi:hypothetical protein
MGLLDSREQFIKENYIGVWELINFLSRNNEYKEIGGYLGYIGAQTSALKLYHLNSFYQITEVNLLYGVYPVIKDVIEKLIYELSDPNNEKKEILEDIQFRGEKYYWKKSDLSKFPELNEIIIQIQKIEISNLDDMSPNAEPSKKDKLYITDVLDEKKDRYDSFIYLIEHFCHTFDLLIYELSTFLLINGFESNITVYININKIEYTALDELSSKKVIYHILNILSDKKFNSTRFESSFDDELMYDFGYIHIEKNSLYQFQPLNDLQVNICSGYEVFGSAKYGDLNIEELNKALRDYNNSQPEIFSDEWYDKYPRSKELRDVTPPQMPEAPSNLLRQKHPALDPDHPNHAPELKLAFELWEEIYMNGKFIESHSKSIEQLLCERGYEPRSTKTYDLNNLAKRIIAVTNRGNPKKTNT